MTLVYIFLLVIAVFVIMSFVSLRKIQKQNNQYNYNGISDDRYYELKYKLQFITSVGVIVIAVAGFFGVDKYENFVASFQKKTDSLDTKIKLFDQKIKSLDSNIVKYDTRINAYDIFLRKMDLSKVKFSKEMLASNKGLLALKDTINNIKKRNVLDKSFYVIDNLQISNYENNATAEINKKFYFRDMTTIIGDQLPIFFQKPVVFVIPQSSADISLIEVTNEYIIVDYGMFQHNGNKEVPKSFAFGLLIARKSE
ncbi:hypothetical protein [Flavobacterium nitrogenifigens]|uniref:Uncharacterized protein n=1 Tax=Flavobacterium nitrogenifigens TaxID=1617283 RepID=A0A521ADU8_9FLAO|nr:hypothetical protein [Flavobacterium nitrogenifigens]KAF2331453.1 hypothetical protein DM397_12000 [Flavobacterium nitrogenifigens]SMO32987.1 hypothetical protein SAMN06265220_10147 [Flavobacterium nitrogenifigens]